MKTADISSIVWSVEEQTVIVLKRSNMDKQQHIRINEVMNMQKIKIVSMVTINGQRMKQEDVDPELFRRLLEEKIDFAMGNIGFKRDKTA